MCDIIYFCHSFAFNITCKLDGWFDLNKHECVSHGSDEALSEFNLYEIMQKDFFADQVSPEGLTSAQT